MSYDMNNELELALAKLQTSTREYEFDSSIDETIEEILRVNYPYLQELGYTLIEENLFIEKLREPVKLYLMKMEIAKKNQDNHIMVSVKKYDDLNTANHEYSLIHFLSCMGVLEKCIKQE